MTFCSLSSSCLLNLAIIVWEGLASDEGHFTDGEEEGVFLSLERTTEKEEGERENSKNGSECR